MSRNLVIVESVTKAKTIEKILGEDFKVVSCVGHISDLPVSEIGVDIQNDFKPKYIIPDEKKQVVKDLKKYVKQSDKVWLASDEDREGEAIAWHLYENLTLNNKEFARIVFHEITKNAILKAIENPRSIDYNLVNAQQARRVLDRLVGYELSPVLWKKVKTGLSAGRVQSVCVRVIVEKEREIQKHEFQNSFKTIGVFNNLAGEQIKSELDIRFKTDEEVKNFFIQNENAIFHIDSLAKKPLKRSPTPPFTTSTLQQEASRKLGFGVSRTMSTAQKLYENGYITYMRTDSINLSKEALTASRNVIKAKYGAEYLPDKPKQYKNKSKNTQEAHEAIRPTDISRLPKENGFSGDERKLYEHIWNRSVSSQMQSADVTQTEIMISSEKEDLIFKATGSQIVFKGFLEVYEEGKDDNEKTSETRLPMSLELNDNLEIDSVMPEQHFTNAPARFTEASLIKELEERGIGRPSTYASIMNSIKKREYASLENKQFKPANKGRVVVSFLDSYFLEYFKYDFTADMEESLDKIAKGELLWTNLLDNFWEGFEPSISSVMELSNREVLEKLNDVLKERLFPKGHTCPDCSAELTLKNSPRFGTFIGCTNFDETGCDYKSPPFLTLE